MLYESYIGRGFILKDNIGELLQLMSIMNSNNKISDIIDEVPKLIEEIKNFKPIETASLVSALLTIPSLHANTIRIEMLIHIIIAYSQGKRIPKAKQITKWLNDDLGNTLFVNKEDPVEDVFISTVMTETGNIRIFEGVWECSDFYLQRFLEIIKKLPDNKKTIQLKREVNSLLKISEEIANRRKLKRYTEGNGIDKQSIKIPTTKQLRSISKSIVFSKKNILDLGINPDDLSPFLFDKNENSKIKDQEMEESELVKHPVYKTNNIFYILLPNNISFSIKTHILKWMIKNDYKEIFDIKLIEEYQQIISDDHRILGPMFKRPLHPPEKIDNIRTTSFLTNISPGYYLNVIMIFDSINEYKENSFNKIEPYSNRLLENINNNISSSINYCKELEAFKQGMTLLIISGYGRPFFVPISSEFDNWLVKGISISDFHTLAWSKDNSPEFLWKLFHFEDLLIKNNIHIKNNNGILNLYGWLEDTNYIIDLQGVDVREQYNILLGTNFLYDIRKKLRHGWDKHVLSLPNGKYVRVQKKNFQNYFPEDDSKPLYACFDCISEELLGVYVGKRSTWWIKTNRNNNISSDITYRIWDAIHNWLERIVNCLENRLSLKNILIILNLNNIQDEQADLVTLNELNTSSHFSVNQKENTIVISLDDSFLGGFRNPKNIAEKVIINKIVEGAFLLSNKKTTSEDISSIVDNIIPNKYARYLHFFEAKNTHDYLREIDNPGKLFIHDIDQSESKLGLGWKVDGLQNEVYSTPKESILFINKVVEVIWRKLHEKLQSFNRTSIILQALRYIEGINYEKETWDHTIRALLDLREDKEVTMLKAVEQIPRFNASSIGLRLVVEMALSESKLDSGLPISKLELTSLMSDVLSMFILGGWSDAIKKGVMNPEIKVAPNGDILSHTEFNDSILEPHGKRFNKKRLNSKSLNYEKLYEPFTPIESVTGLFPEQFLSAFQEEFGFSIDALRGILNALEDLAYTKQKCVFIAHENEILSHCEESELISKKIAKLFLKQFSLWPRKSWDYTPKGYKNSDWYPWKFNRKLSLVSRPIIKLKNNDNPRYIIAPGLIADSTILTISRYYEADVITTDCRSSKMRRWIDDEKARLSNQFVIDVSKELQKYGYEVKIEASVNELLNIKTKKGYGDVDVLAWKKGKNKVMSIECKDLKIAKTPNEIAEQLNRFSGQVLSNGKPDKLLKHIYRYKLLNENKDQLSKILKLHNKELEIYSIVCFSLPVPMQYIEKRIPNTTFITIDDLPELISDI